MENCVEPIAHFDDLKRLLCLGIRKELSEDSYYTPRGAGDCPFAEAELEAARYIIDTFNEDTQILEAGCGAGQLCLLLGAAGFTRVTGVEMDPARYAAAVALRTLISTDARWPNIRRVGFVHAEYPAGIAALPAVLVTMNVVSSAWDAQAVPYSALRNVQHAIIDARLWRVVREDPKEQADLVQDMLARAELRKARQLSPGSTIWHLKA